MFQDQMQAMNIASCCSLNLSPYVVIYVNTREQIMGIRSKPRMHGVLCLILFLHPHIGSHDAEVFDQAFCLLQDSVYQFQVTLYSLKLLGLPGDDYLELLLQTWKGDSYVCFYAVQVQYRYGVTWTIKKLDPRGKTALAALHLQETSRTKDEKDLKGPRRATDIMFSKTSLYRAWVF